MENKTSATAEEKAIEVSFSPSEKHSSSLAGKKKMKYFRKSGWCDQEKHFLFLRKRRYSLFSLASVDRDYGQTFHMNQILRTQKSIMSLETWTEEFFPKSWRPLQNLRRLILYSQFSMSNAKIKRLRQQVSSNLRYLLDLHLYLERSQEVPDPAFESLAKHIGNYFKALKILRLDMPKSNITDTGVKSLAENIGNNLKSLQTLRLNFQECSGISDIGLNCFTKYIRNNLRSLEDLNLDFSKKDVRQTHWGEIKDAGVQSLAEFIGNLKLLQFLRLNLENNEDITDLGVQSLAENIGNNLTSLELLEINFAGNKKITDAGVQSLSDHIGENLESLQYISFDFYQSVEITDAEMQSLAEHITTVFPKILRSHLRFGGCIWWREAKSFLNGYDENS